MNSASIDSVFSLLFIKFAAPGKPILILKMCNETIATENSAGKIYLLWFVMDRRDDC